MTTRHLEEIRFWALRAAEQSREYGEPEEDWARYLDAADRVSDILDQREQCGRRLSRYAGCGSLKLRASEAEREFRDGCFFPLCLISNMRWPTGRLRFKE